MAERMGSRVGSAVALRARAGLEGWLLVGWSALALGAMRALLLAVHGAREEGLRVVIRATARTSLALFLAAFAASSLRRLWRSRRAPAAAALALLGLAGVADTAGAAPIAFLVAEPPGSVVHGDSYVLVLQDPADVDHARALAQQGPAAGAPIAVARIVPGGDGQNRDLRAPGEPPWSWHVTDFEGFADITTEVCDGWPGYVEQDVAGWIANTNGTVCFWRYTVVEELPEVGQALALAAGAMALAAARLKRGARRRDTLSI